MINLTSLIAQAGDQFSDGTSEQAATDFLNSFGPLRAILGIIGLGVLLASAFSAYGMKSRGSVSKAVGTLMFGVVAAAFLFSPALLLSLVDIATSIIGALINAITDTVN